MGIVLVVSRPGAFDLKAGWLTNHLLLGVGAVVVVAIVAWVLGRRFRDGLAAAQEGAAILATPRRYASQVLAVEVASYVTRMAVTTTFMYAYDVPVSARAVLLITAVNSISTTFAATQQLILTAWDVVLGFVLLWSTIGWTATRHLVSREGRGRAGSSAREE